MHFSPRYRNSRHALLQGRLGSDLKAVDSDENAAFFLRLLDWRRGGRSAQRRASDAAAQSPAMFCKFHARSLASSFTCTRPWAIPTVGLSARREVRTSWWSFVTLRNLCSGGVTQSVRSRGEKIKTDSLRNLCAVTLLQFPADGWNFTRHALKKFFFLYSIFNWRNIQYQCVHESLCLPYNVWHYSSQRGRIEAFNHFIGVTTPWISPQPDWTINPQTGQQQLCCRISCATSQTCPTDAEGNEGSLHSSHSQIQDGCKWYVMLNLYQKIAHLILRKHITFTGGKKT